MSEFTNYGRRNHIDFGDYTKYPQGTGKELHVYKVVGALKSNTYRDPPDWHGAKESIHGEMVPILNVIHCGLDETKVIRVKESDCVKMDTCDYHNPSDISEISRQTEKIGKMEDAIKKLMQIQGGWDWRNNYFSFDDCRKAYTEANDLLEGVGDKCTLDGPCPNEKGGRCASDGECEMREGLLEYLTAISR
jgi:hypothetical protein